MEVTASGPHLNVDFEGYSHNPDSPVSEIPDYAGESDLDSVHLQCGGFSEEDSNGEGLNEGYESVTGISRTVTDIRTKTSTPSTLPFDE